MSTKPAQKSFHWLLWLQSQTDRPSASLLPLKDLDPLPFQLSISYCPGALPLHSTLLTPSVS